MVSKQHCHYFLNALDYVYEPIVMKEFVLDLFFSNEEKVPKK